MCIVMMLFSELCLLHVQICSTTSKDALCFCTLVLYLCPIESCLSLYFLLCFQFLLFRECPYCYASFLLIHFMSHTLIDVVVATCLMMCLSAPYVVSLLLFAGPELASHFFFSLAYNTRNLFI